MKRRISTCLWFAAGVAALASLVGCAGLSVNGAPPYFALGDFITDGATLANPTEQAYPALVAFDRAKRLSNLANSGDQACDVPARQIFPNAVSPTLAGPATYSVLIGVNDVDNQGTGAYEAVFMECHQATLGWLALPVEQKVLYDQSGFEANGPGAPDTANGWNAWATAGQGSSVSFTITLAAPGAIYAWPLMDDSSTTAYTVRLDGAIVSSNTVATNPRMTTANKTARSLGFLRWPAIAAGRHTVTFTQSTPGSAGVTVVGIGSPAAVATPDSDMTYSSKSTAALPMVLAGTIPRQLHTGASVGCQSTDAPCEEYNLDIVTDAAIFAGDGLNVKVFDTRGYLQGTAADMADATHPNAKGQQALSEAVQAAWAAQY